ncbi:hypothetical protein ACQ1P5_01450 [Ornithobacterium rhinotracheale]
MSNKIKIQRVHSEYYVVNGKAFILNSQGEWVTPFDTPTEEEKMGKLKKLLEGRKLIVLRLDKNFHIYLHGDKEKISEGEDEKGTFIKLYYKELK